MRPLVETKQEGMTLIRVIGGHCALCAAFFMVILDATIVLVALPSIQADLGFSEQACSGC